MHFEILVEDQSGKKMLDILLPKIIEDADTFVVYAYKGIGRIPQNMRDPKDASRRILLDSLTKLLKGYGRTQAGRPDFSEAVIVVCDLDDKCQKKFRAELLRILNACRPKPKSHFCLAIEEGEAWLLGDFDAIRAAYPTVRRPVLNSYVNDCICGTWEKLADAVYPGGEQALSAKGWQAIGQEKSKWAQAITPFMVVGKNRSPSFCYFRDKIQALSGVN